MKLDVAINLDTNEIIINGVDLRSDDASGARCVYESLCQLSYQLQAWEAWRERHNAWLVKSPHYPRNICDP